MTTHCTCLRDLGQTHIWRLLDEMRHPLQDTHFLVHCRALTLLTQQSPTTLEDRLSFTESIRSYGGRVQEIGSESWLQSKDALAMQSPLYAAHANILLVQNLEESLLSVFATNSTVPVLNMGNTSNHPALALSDLAFIHEHKEDLSALRIAWVGGLNGLAFSLIEAAMYIPFELFMAFPEWSEPDHELLDLALRAGAKIFLSRDPALVLDGADVVYCGTGPQAELGHPLTTGIYIRKEDMQLTHPQALLLSAQPLSPYCRADQPLLEHIRRHWTRRLQLRIHLQALLIQHLLQSST